MYAIIQTGGKQYRAKPGDVLDIEKLEGDVGHKITFNDLLLVGGYNEGQTLVGKPFVQNAKLEAEIVEQTRGDKIHIIKYRRRKGYRRTLGHRQSLTRLLIVKVENGSGQTLELDSAKRKEALIKASVPFSTRQKERDAARGPQGSEAKAKKASAPKAASAAAPKKASATKEASSAKAKPAAAKKTTKAKK